MWHKIFNAFFVTVSDSMEGAKELAPEDLEKEVCTVSMCVHFVHTHTYIHT